MAPDRFDMIATGDLGMVGSALLLELLERDGWKLQGRHADYHQALFAGGEVRPAAELDEDSLIALAEELDLDVERFTADLRSEEVARTVEEHAAEGVELGAVTTPSFVLDGTPTVGAQPTEVFTQLVDEALAESEG